MEKTTMLVTSLCYYMFLAALFLSCLASSKTVVTQLPGFDGDLPFYLETGYIGVGESNASQLFYYFVKSQRSPALDPLMLWLTGGPGCSVLSAFLYESGPVTFDYTNYNGSLPSLHLNPYAWTQGINIIYVDAPIGTGFSYSTTDENYYIDDMTSSNQTYEFLRKWLIEHPEYLTNQLYMGGDSYSGIPLPIIVTKILEGNEAGLEPRMNLKGYILGNPKTDDYLDVNSAVPYCFRLALISEELYETTKEDCGGNYVTVNASNVDCVADLDAIDELILEINLMNVLEPTCQVARPRNKKGSIREISEGRRSLIEEEENISISELDSAHWCRYYNYVLCNVWANTKIVRDALQIRENTTGIWKRCNATIAYTKTVTSSLPYHKYLSQQDLRSLIYSGDHDLSVPHIGTQNWIQLLNMTVNEYWRPWFVDGQVAGYAEKYMNSDFNMQFATVKGAGHVAPEYKPAQCYAMIDRFMATYPL
ncbi:serine carboxypeptidase-like 18 [Euphorbia lathyris]|uniref:serine carboxypeptidase-like 18 n=1 Tax=Euphorbia lathyris TaxID=212925 RepID=UPI003313F925